jgi:hypothetical protein
LNTNGRSRNARLWYFLSLTISAVIVLITPVFPFPMPAKTRQHITAGMLVENPKPMFEIMESVSPIIMLGFLPSLFATLAHGTDVANCENAKRETRSPACRDIEAGLVLGAVCNERMR